MSLSRALSAVRLRLPSLAVRRLSQRALPPPSASGRRLGLRAGAGAALLCSFAAYEHFREDFDCGLRLVVAQPQQQEPQTQPVDTDVESYDMTVEVAQLILQAKRAAKDGELAMATSILEQAVARAQKAGISNATVCGIRNKAANHYLALRRYELALGHFVEVLRALTVPLPDKVVGGTDGQIVVARTSPEAVEISLKMAACYDAMGKADMAASGYDWCLKEATALLAKAQEKAKAEPEQLSGARSLVGMVSEEYGLHLRSQGKHEEAHAQFQTSLAQAEALGPLGAEMRARAYFYLAGESLDAGNLGKALEEAKAAVDVCKASACEHMDAYKAQLDELATAMAKAGQ